MKNWTSSNILSTLEHLTDISEYSYLIGYPPPIESPYPGILGSQCTPPALSGWPSSQYSLAPTTITRWYLISKCPKAQKLPQPLRKTNCLGPEDSKKSITSPILGPDFKLGDVCQRFSYCCSLPPLWAQDVLGKLVNWFKAVLKLFWTQGNVLNKSSGDALNLVGDAAPWEVCKDLSRS